MTGRDVSIPEEVRQGPEKWNLVVGQLLQQISKRNQRLSWLKTEHRGLVEEVQEREQAVQALSMQLAAKERTLAEREEAIAAISAQVAERDGQIAALQATVSERDHEVMRLAGEVSSLEAQVTGRDELGKLRHELSALANTNSALGQEMSALQESKADLEQDLSAARVDRDRLKEREGALVRQLKRAHQLLRDINGKLDASQQELRSLQVVFGGIQEQLDHAQETIKRHEAFIQLQYQQFLAKEAELDTVWRSRYWRWGALVRSMVEKIKQAIRLLRILPKLPYRRAWQSVRRRGFKKTYQVTMDYVGTVASDSRNISSPKAQKAVLFLSGCPGDAKRYRCDHQVEQLQMLGVTCDVGLYGQMNLNEVLDCYQCFILHRVPFGPDIDRFISQVRYGAKPVIFDTDDWVFDLDAVPYVPALDEMNEAERSLYVEGLSRYRETLLRCDAVLVTSESLQRLARKVHDRVYVAHNVVSQEMVDLADRALLKKSVREAKSKVQGDVTIAYLSGTPTHNRDFLEAADAVLWALDTYASVRFKAVGHIKLDERFEKFGDRVESVCLVPWQQLPEIIANVDINLAPLERDNPFTDSKSCLKYIEAGSVSVPTVASPRDDFVGAIDHGRNGFLADTPQEWQDALRQLIEFPELREDIGRRAYEDVRQHHTSKAQASALYNTIQGLAHSGTEPKPLTVNWIVRAPIAGTGGGYRTIFRLADHLVARGHVVRIYVEPIAHLAQLSAGEITAFLEENFGPLKLEVFVGHEHILPADASIATNWPTAYRVAYHDESVFKSYFIQDFEPEFYEADDPLYREAEKTYGLPLRHVCIGRHLMNRIRCLTGKPADWIDFAIDVKTFYMKVKPEERPDPIKVLFFARPGMKRRGYELGLEALYLLKKQRPELEILFFGATQEELVDVPFDFHNLGVLTPDMLAEVMNEVHILLSFSLSDNISWVPFEGMASGCAVLEANLPSVAGMVSPGRNCLLADPEPHAVAEALIRLANDGELRIKLANQAASDMRTASWENTAAQFEEILVRRCFVRLGEARKLSNQHQVEKDFSVSRGSTWNAEISGETLRFDAVQEKRAR